MRVLLFSFICILYVSVLSAAWSAQPAGSSAVQNIVRFEVTYNPLKGVRNIEETADIYGLRDTPLYYIGGGIQASASSFSAEAGASWYVIHCTHLKLGPSVFFNYLYLPEYMDLYNYMGGVTCMVFLCHDTVHIQCDVSYMRKIMVIGALEEYIPYIASDDPVVNIAFSKQWKSLTATAKLASSEAFYYPRFAHPAFSLGLSWQCTPRTAVSVLGTAVYSDMFTLTSYLDHVSVQTGIAFRF